jgi:RHS repeat-associated protein
MQMQLASNSVLSQPPLAAMPQLSEKPHLGFATKKTAWNPGPNVCNFTVTLGLQVVVSENGVRKTYSARYYNPSTGRFLSRDPEEGHISIPVTLHKYLYASGNPVNRLDRSGKADEEEEAGLDLRSLTKSVNYAAGQLNIERQLFGEIIHAIKFAAKVGGATTLYFSIPSGDVYLLIEDEYELIDNVFAY